MTETAGQRCVERCSHTPITDGFGMRNQNGACAACIDALVRRERDGAVKPLADAMQAFRNLPQLGRLVKLRATPEYVALVDAWDRVAGRYCACGPDVPAHDGVCQGCERVIRGCD